MMHNWVHLSIFNVLTFVDWIHSVGNNFLPYATDPDIEQNLPVHPLKCTNRSVHFPICSTSSVEHSHSVCGVLCMIFIKLVMTAASFPIKLQQKYSSTELSRIFSVNRTEAEECFLATFCAAMHEIYHTQ